MARNRYGLQWAEVQGRDMKRLVVREKYFPDPAARARFETALLGTSGIVEVMGRMG